VIIVNFPPGCFFIIFLVCHVGRSYDKESSLPNGNSLQQYLLTGNRLPFNNLGNSKNKKRIAIEHATPFLIDI
jgi:hypothetical protein